LIILLNLTACLPGKKAKYNIIAPTDGNFHAIIMIQNKVKGSSCSAFVVSDTIALTAAHCLDTTKSFMDFEYKELWKKSDKLIAELKAQMEDVEKRCYPTHAPQCSQIMMNLQNVYNEEIEARKEALTLKVDEFSVSDVNGVDTTIKAIAYHKNDKRDYGFIKGDFRKFKKLKVKHTFDIEKGDTLKACGFPGATIPAICMNFEAVGQANFMYKGYSMFVPGISGGPVIDASGEVVGIASRVNGDYSLIETTVGILNETVGTLND
jgi:V8-like Glu-specific endopeptidase